MSSTTTPAKQAADVDEIRRALDLLTVPGGVVEIRGLHVPTGRGKPCTVAGYFLDLDKAAEAAAALDTRKAAGVYLVLNEVNPALLARSPDQLTDHLDPTTSDGDIIRRRWLPLDVDPIRPAGVSSSEDEHCSGGRHGAALRGVAVFPRVAGTNRGRQRQRCPPVVSYRSGKRRAEHEPCTRRDRGRRPAIHRARC